MKKLRIGLLLAVLAALLLGIGIWAKRDTGHHHVSLTWQAPPPMPEVTVVGYNVYRRLSPGDRYSRLADRVSTPRYEDSFVQSGRTYFYVVTSLDQSGRESRFSREIAVTVP
jgi:fibronectin type 3 domain-containing protein